MLRICIAILLAVVVNTEKSEIRYSASDTHAEVPSEDNAVISNPSEYSREISRTQYGVSSYRNNKENTESIIDIPRYRGNTRSQKKKRVNNKVRTEDGTFKGYPSSRALRINDKEPDEIKIEEFNIDPPKLETQNFKDYQKASEITVNNVAIKQNPKTFINVSQTSGLPSIDASIRNSQVKKYNYGASNYSYYTKPETLTDSYESKRTGYDSIKLTYGIPKSLNTGYRTQKSRKPYDILKPFEHGIGEINNEDFKVTKTVNKESVNDIGTYKQSNTEYDLTINNIANREMNSKTNLYDSAEETTDQKNIPKLDENYPPNFHAKISKTNYSSKENLAKDQVFDNSNNFEERFQDYSDEKQRFSSDVDDYNESYSRGDQSDYDSKDYYESSGLSDSSDDFLRSSPGIIGITQAIIRPHLEFNVPRKSKSRNQYIPQNYDKIIKRKFNLPSRQRDISLVKTTPDVDFGLVGKRNKEHNQNGYPSGRDNQENGKVPAVYRFEYAVSDKGNDYFGHKESRQDAKTRGSYHVILPDGRKQIVEYEADEHGFKPRIRYEKTGYAIGPARGYDDRKSGSALGLSRSVNSDRQTGYDIDY